MAVQTSLARCLRATPFLRPLPQFSSFSSRGQIYQVYQRSGYASNESPNTNESATTGSTVNEPPKPTTSSPTTTNASDLSDSAADQASKLAERMADIRNKMKVISKPAKNIRTSRVFFPDAPARDNSSKDIARAEALATATLERLASKGKQQSASEGSQQQESSEQQQKEPTRPLVSPRKLGPLDEISPPPRLRPVPMKLGTKLGRQVWVQNDKGMDCATAIRNLQMNCTANGVRRQANLQKFHIRRGQRRKDLKSERWRKLFKFSFDETVKKIQRMRDQGW